MLGIGLHSYGFMDSAFHTLKWFAVTQILLMMAACQPMMHWVSGASLAKTHDRTISLITAGVMGIGILLQIGAFFTDENKGGLMMYGLRVGQYGLCSPSCRLTDWIDPKKTA